MPYDREPILRKARDLIATEWDSTATNGIGPNEPPPLDLTVHTRGRNAEISDPQVRLLLIDETRAPSGFAGDGSGPVIETSGLLQANCIVGSGELLTDGGISDDPEDVASNLAQEVARIWHAQAPTGLPDGSGGVAYDNIYPGQTRDLPSSQRESDPASVGRLIELNYEYEDKTPP